MTEHTIRAFDTDLDDLSRMIADMGGLAEKQTADAIDALIRRDTVLAQHIISSDLKIDALQHEIEKNVVSTIARRQPMAIDLREVIGALRISNDLERIGDLSKNIAKRVQALEDDLQPKQVMRGIEHMSNLVLAQLKNVLDSYARRDIAKAISVWQNDKQIDAANNSLFRELLTYMMEDLHNISFCIHLIFCTKNIERMGDHATNIAETVYFIIEGKTLPDDRPKGDTTSETSFPFNLERRSL